VHLAGAKCIQGELDGGTAMTQESATTVRATWDFSYKTTEVYAAASKQAKHHASRYEWWEAESKAAEKLLKEKGFEYREEQFSRGADMVIVGDPQLVKRLTDCKRMMEDHAQNQDLFEVWTRALRGKSKKEPDSELVLKVDDVVYFGL
jgi:hypothetical protein